MILKIIGIDCDNLKEGTSICVEIDASKSEKKNSFDEYISKKNDTCEKIAKKTNSSINALLNVNSMYYIFKINSFVIFLKKEKKKVHIKLILNCF